jgi:hypothetical protein
MYMARGDKKTAAEAAATPIQERGTMPKALIEDDREDQRGEFNPAGLKRNTETGEMYDPSGEVLGRPAIIQRPVVATPGGAFQSATPAAPAGGPRIVSKEELAKSGLSLRDFLNKERGLTRRVEREPASISSRKPNVIYDAEGKEVRPLKKGGAVKMASGGSVNSASRRGDGIAQRGKTRGRMR